MDVQAPRGPCLREPLMLKNAIYGNSQAHLGLLLIRLRQAKISEDVAGTGNYVKFVFGPCHFAPWLKRERDSGEDTAGAGFLPGEIDAVDDGEGGNDGNDPKDGAHAIEDPADDEEHDALGALHEADFAQGDERLGAGAGVTDHDGAGGGDGGEDDVGSAAADGIVDQEAHVEGHVGVTVESGIVEGAEGGDAVLAAGDLTVEHVQEAGEENDQSAGEKTANGKEGGGDKIHNQPKKSEEVGINSGGGDRANNFVQQPFAAGSNCAGKGSHKRLIVSQNHGGLAKSKEDCGGREARYFRGETGRPGWT